MIALGLVVGMVGAAALLPINGADLTTFWGRPAVHIRSTNWYVTAPQPAVRTLELGEALATHAGQDVRVCVRSAHSGPGTLWVTAPRLVGHVEFPHGGRLRTRCTTAEVVARPRTRWAGVTVQEGTYVREAGDQHVHGWVRSVSIREPR